MPILDYIISIILAFFRAPKQSTAPAEPSAPGAKPSEPAPVPQGSGRHLITEPERITARFHDTGSPAWAGQFAGTPMAGQHGGTDFSAPQGSPVYAPYVMRVIVVNYYPDAGRRGFYVIGILDDGSEYYSGHLQGVKVVPGSRAEPGTVLGETNEYNHTHVQIKQRGSVIDPEAYLAAHP